MLGVSIGSYVADSPPLDETSVDKRSLHPDVGFGMKGVGCRVLGVPNDPHVAEFRPWMRPASINGP